MEFAIPYVITGPDGTRAVIGNSDTARADPDWCGFIDTGNGIVGLDGAEVRESAENLTEQDGGAHGPFYEGRRPVIPHVVLDPSLLGGTHLPAWRKLRRACRALRADTTLRWTPSDIGIEVELRLRRNGKPTLAGLRPKSGQLPMIAADPAIRSSAEAQLTIDPTAAPATVGYSSPYDSPYGTEFAAVGAGHVVNQGDVEAIPRFVLNGPVTNPEILNNTTGKRIKLTTVLAAGELLEIDVGRRTVELLTPGALGEPTNHATDPSGEAGAKFASFGDFAVTREAGGTGGISAYAGGYRDKHAYDGTASDTTVANYPFTFPAAGQWVVSMYVWIPSSWNGSTLRIDVQNYAGSSGQTKVMADLSKRDQWQRVYTYITIAAGDLSGQITLRYDAAAPSSAATGIVYTDALLIEEGATPSDYFDGDTPGYQWTGAAYASTSKKIASYGRAGRDSLVVYPDTKWWRLEPGSNDVRLLASAYSAGAALVVYWRHSWE